MECTFVNKFIKNSSDIIIMETWFDKEFHMGSWQTDARVVLSGHTEDKEWLTMNENIKACAERFKGYEVDKLDSEPVFKVKVEYEKYPDYSFKWAKVIETSGGR